MLHSGSNLAYRRRAWRTALLMGPLGLLVGLTSVAAAQTTGDYITVPVRIPNVIYRSVLKSHTNPAKVLHIAVTLKMPHAAQAQAFADSVNDPTNPNYGKYLTPEEFGAKFGQPAADFQAVKDYLISQGFNVVLTGRNKLSLLAQCTVGQAEKAFGTTINDYQTKSGKEPGSQNYFSFADPLQLPKAIAPLVLDISGVQSFTRPVPRALTATQTRSLYNTAPIYASGMHGEGRTVAISNWDGYRLSNLPVYYSAFGLPVPPGGVGSNVQVISMSGGSGSGTPSGEGDLDIQMVLGSAPLSNFMIYDDGSFNLVAVLTKEADDNAADIISESYGWNLDSSTLIAAHNVHVQMSAQGITYMCASGDSGTSLEPYSYSNFDGEVLMVGGTVATVGASGNRTSEVAWSGGGGGWSTNAAPFNVRPSWQVGNGVPTTINYRLSPDVALNASGSTGAYQFVLNGVLTDGYDGTSFACPVFAGSLALAEQRLILRGGLPANAAGKRRMGRIQNLVYSQNGDKNIYFDVTSGSNGTLPNGNTSFATPGWDFATGWGAVDFLAFANSIVVVPPVQIMPLSAQVFQSWGTNPLGDASKLAKADSVYYSAVSVAASGVGTVVAAQVKFTLSGDISKIASLSGTIVANAQATCTNYIYALNVKTNLFDLVKTAPLSTTNSTIPFTLTNWKDYVNSSNQVTIVERAINPARLGGAKFTLKIDQAVLLEAF